MPERAWKFRWRDMPTCCQRSETYAACMSFQHFQVSGITVDAVLHDLAIIGEAANGVPSDVRYSMQSILWRDVRGISKRLIHDDPGVDLQLVWKTIAQTCLRWRQPSSQRSLNSIERGQLDA